MGLEVQEGSEMTSDQIPEMVKDPYGCLGECSRHRNGKCKGPEVGTCMACSENSKDVRDCWGSSGDEARAVVCKVMGPLGTEI